VESAGDHQVNEKEQVPLKADDDALSKTAKADDRLAIGLLDGGIDGTKHKWAGEANPLE
jgi:hypothetical protein